MDEENKLLKSNNQENIKTIKNIIKDDLLKSRVFNNINYPDIDYAIIYLTNLVKKETIQQTIISPILKYDKKIEAESVFKTISSSILTSSEVIKADKLSDIVKEILSGKVVMFINNSAQALVIEANDRITRSPTEPEGEKLLRGPREGFNESLLANLSMVRRKIISSDLRFEQLEIGEVTKTKTCICYLENTVDKEALKILKDRLSLIKFDGILDTNSLAEMIKGEKGFFKVHGTTERPDTLSAKILTGKIGILVDGSPVAIYIPHLFIENFHTSDDQYVNNFFASFSRAIRMIGFFISISLPSIYVAITTHHWEILPSQLLITLTQSQQGVPFPTIVECIFLLLVFELLREAGSRATSGVSQPLSIVGALVIGQAAVEARLVSSPMVVVVALTAIAGLINPRIQTPSIAIRFIHLFVGALLGVYGFFFITFALLNFIISRKSFGRQYIEGLVPINLKTIKENIFRFPSSLIDKKSEDKVLNQGETQ